MKRKNRKMEHIMAAAIAAGTALSTLTAFAETYAKLENGTFAFYADAECTEPTTSQTALDADTTLYFASAGDFDALKPHKDEIVSSGAKVTLQNDITLETDADWRDFDFDLNDNTITLAGWTLKAGCIAGSGTITAGELVVNGGFESSAWRGWNPKSNGDWDRVDNCNICILKNGNQLYKTDGSYWVALWTTNDNHSAVAAINQTVTLPKDGTYYLTFRYQTGAWGDNKKYNYYDFFSGAPKLSVTAGSIKKDDYTPNKSIKTGCIELAGKSAGENLQLIFASNNKAYGLCIDDVSLTPLSTLELDIPSGTEYDAGGLTLKGTGLQVFKKGGGKVVFSKSNASWRYNGYTSLVVDEGYAKQTAANACGAQYSKITVRDGGQFDINGFTYWDYHYAISGTGPADDGALTSSAAIGEAAARKTEKKGFLYNVTLNADATVCASEGANFGMWVFYPEGGSSYNGSTMTMNGHTVTYDCLTPGGAIIYLGGMSYSGEGKIVVAANARVQPHNKNLEAKGCDVEVYGDWKQNNYVLSPVKSLVFKEGSKFGEWKNSPEKTTVVLERYAPNQGVEDGNPPGKHPRVQLGSADSPKELNAGLERPVVTLDLTEFNGVFDDSEKGLLTFYNTGNEDAPTKVYVEVSEKRCLRGHVFYKWKTKPENVEFVRGKTMEDAQVQLQVNDDGLYAGPGSTIILR